ncbi:MAG: amino acid ABC transporter permease [Synergistaceae bacterium]|nr:amino acid ABC transporter permease [Synergistaceae bacterium]MBQ3449133.1 amino acid ABC transporter permease [Synergistaceae bacterium]MBQ3694521.1 amino acid ABC transporter permease [Synergistaceae bacterium]MBQ6111851.1 amino acid ABC transporter permease [Synergistaceae bacterium]MBQ9629726.1 amino acid ABC transporter permease [Synergistaceae bacterium]
MSLNEILYKILIQGGSYMTILKGLSATVQISLFSLIFGTLLGAVICALRMSKIRIINTIAAAYIVLLRGSPVLMLLMLMYYGVFARSSLEAQTIAVITFSMNVAAHVAELLRASISATDHGQVEAARTLGFSAWQAFRLVTLPQVIRIAKPVYQSTVVNLIQWTSVVGYVSITDLTRVINNIASRTMQPMITIIIGMLIYLALAYIVHGIFALSDLMQRHREEAA